MLNRLRRWIFACISAFSYGQRSKCADLLNSYNNSIYDVVIAIGLGILGVVLAKLEIPNTPVVLGLILGSIIESNFVRTYTIVHAEGKNLLVYVLTRPLCIAILLLTIYLIYANVKALRRGKEIGKDSNIQQDLQED